MKAKKTLFALWIPIFCFVLIGFIEEVESNRGTPGTISTIPPAPGKDFLNYVISISYSTAESNMFIDNFLSRISNELHFNMVHSYGKKEESTIYETFGTSPSPTQITNTNALYSSIGAAGLRLLGGRTNIEHMCYAQRLVYEVPAYQDDDETNYGFCYQNYRGVLENDNGRTVLHACPNGTCPNSDANAPGYILENIYENLQFGDLFDFHQADASTWYIKPVMKIPTGLDPNTNIVKIVVINYDEQTILEVPIKAGNFSTAGTYTQNYINFPAGVKLEVPGNTTPGVGLNAGVDLDDWRDWGTECKIDFKIWWYGEADVWIDKLIVDDEVGNKLFNPDTLQNYDNVIKAEANAFGSNQYNYAFYTDELPYSNYSAARYVDSLLKVGNSNAKFHYTLSNYHHTRGHKNNDLGHQPAFENVQPLSVQIDAHEFFNTRIPYQFNNVNSEIPDDWKSISNWYYNNEIQITSLGDRTSVVDDTVKTFHNNPKPNPWGSLIYQVNQAREQRDAYAPGTKLIINRKFMLFQHIILRKINSKVT